MTGAADRTSARTLLLTEETHINTFLSSVNGVPSLPISSSPSAVLPPGDRVRGPMPLPVLVPHRLMPSFVPAAGAKGADLWLNRSRPPDSRCV